MCHEMTDIHGKFHVIHKHCYFVEKFQSCLIQNDALPALEACLKHTQERVRITAILAIYNMSFLEENMVIRPLHNDLLCLLQT